jgi:probable HAF family extracellular repeat protein
MWHESKRTPLNSILLVALCFRMNGASNADCPSYSVDIISLPYCGLPFYGIAPAGLSESGYVTGAYNTCGGDAGAFYWVDDSLTLFDVEPDALGVGRAINSKFQIVGSKDDEKQHIGFLYENGSAIDVGMLPGCNYAEAYAINESSQVVGYANNVLTGPLKAFLWQKGKQEALQLPSGPNSSANDINDHGQIVGWMGDGLLGEAFFWDNGVATGLGYPPGGVYSEARAISNNGKITGRFVIPNPSGEGFLLRGFLWDQGQWADLGTLLGYVKCFVHDVNDQGIVVGQCTDQDLGGPAFIWRDGVMTDLNELVPSEMNLDLRIAKAINNNGQILCEAFDEHSSFVAVLLSPIPSPIGDLNCNGSVDVDDLLGVINSWGDETPKSSSAMPPADFSHNHVVDVDDLLIVINNWTE